MVVRSLCLLTLSLVLAIDGVPVEIALGDQNVVMPWLCLERCNNASVIHADVNQTLAHSTSLGAASFEAYDVGDNGELKLNGFSKVNHELSAGGLATYPMLTTVSISRIRALFANPKPLINAAIHAAITLNYTGWNVDFECSGGNATDALHYTQFVDEFAKALHAVGKTLSVDLGRELVICKDHESPWKFADVAKTAVDTIITMDTYASTWSDFTESLTYGLSTVGPHKLGVGLSTFKLETMALFTEAEMVQRFNLVQSAGVKVVGIWVSPLPDWWFPLIDKYRASM